MTDVKLLATHGLCFDGVLQLQRVGDESSRGLRDDCPRGDRLACIETVPPSCEHFTGIRRSETVPKFWILCNCTQRNKP